MTAPADSTTTDAADATTDAATVDSTTTSDAAPEADLDDKAKRVIAAIRGDFKNERTQRQAAESRAQAITDAIKTALGLDAPDPAALASQLAEQQSTARQAQVELAVFRAAASAGGNPNALLDSRSFVNALNGVDPTDAEAVSAAIKAAVAANPTLASTPARRIPAPNPAAGGSANGAPDLETQIAQAKKDGNWKTVLHLENQKLIGSPLQPPTA
jgi:hypothetical protein